MSTEGCYARLPDSSCVAGVHRKLPDENCFTGICSAPTEEQRALHALRRALRRACRDVHEKHKALTAAWGSPLSLLSKDDATVALQQGVAQGFIDVVQKAKGLAQTAAELSSVAEIYEANICVVLSGTRRVRLQHEPVKSLVETLEDLSYCVATNLSKVVTARAAFDNPSQAAANDLITWIFPRDHADFPMSVLVEVQNEVYVPDVVEDHPRFAPLRLTILGLLGYPVNFGDDAYEEYQLKEQADKPTYVPPAPGTFVGA